MVISLFFSAVFDALSLGDHDQCRFIFQSDMFEKFLAENKAYKLSSTDYITLDFTAAVTTPYRPVDAPVRVV